MEDPIPKQSQKQNAYVCFHLREHLGKGRFQTFQVWVWGSDVARIVRLGIKKGSMIWICGSMELVECTQQRGKVRTKVQKVFCSNFGFLPTNKESNQTVLQENSISDPPSPPAVVELDGNRMPLPE